jgi:tRNA1(Val) A37 N6-methylase TrmN6
MQLTPNQDESLDQLAGRWRVFQLKRGHRFSTDDLVTAWHASTVKPQARKLLDIGCGIGSVGLSTLWRVGHEDATLTAVEAQEVSVGLYRRSIAYNALESRVTLHHSDLRGWSPEDPSERFELITGSPPYIPASDGIISPHPQRAHCRMELRGNVYDYCVAAKRWLAPGGRFVFVMLAQDPRTEDGPVQAGLQVVDRWDYVFREGRVPHIATLVCAHAEEELGERTHRTILIRHQDGSLGDVYSAFRDEMKTHRA